MSQSALQSNSILPDELARERADFTVIDVRKTRARGLSGKEVAGGVRRLPFDAQNWWREFEGRRVVVYCLHGLEVGQAVCGFLRDGGIDARYLEGGFEAWENAGLPTAPIDGAIA